MCGHNVAGVTGGEYCLAGKDTNQINRPYNLIRTQIYHNDGWVFIPLVTIERAYVMFAQTQLLNCWASLDTQPCTQQEHRFYHDLGIIRPMLGTTFKERPILSFIVPICLPAEDAQIPSKNPKGKPRLITIVGDGIQYNELPDGKASNWKSGSRNPSSTSCTTSQLGNTNHDTTRDTKVKRCKSVHQSTTGSVPRR